MANAIQRIREQRGMTVRDVGKLMRVASSTVTRMEHKDLRKLSMEKLSRVAKALGVSVNTLLTTRGVPNAR